MISKLSVVIRLNQKSQLKIYFKKQLHVNLLILIQFMINEVIIIMYSYQSYNFDARRAPCCRYSCVTASILNICPTLYQIHTICSTLCVIFIMVPLKCWTWSCGVGAFLAVCLGLVVCAYCLTVYILPESEPWAAKDLCHHVETIVWPW